MLFISSRLYFQFFVYIIMTDGELSAKIYDTNEGKGKFMKYIAAWYVKRHVCAAITFCHITLTLFI